MFVITWMILSGCIENITIDVPARTEHIVVFGWITNEAETYSIRVNRTNGFNDQSPYEPVTDAEVFVLDRVGTRFDFMELGNSGLYRSDPGTFTGVSGNAYELHILTLDGVEIVSSREQLRPLPELDTVLVRQLEEPISGTADPPEDIYYLSGIIMDEADIRNFYRWKVYINDTLLNSPDDIVLFNDKFTDGNRFRFDANNILFNNNDHVRVEHISLSQTTYDYYTQLKDLTDVNAIGTISQSYSLHGNLSIVDSNELVLGIFGASEVHRIEVQAGN